MADKHSRLDPAADTSGEALHDEQLEFKKRARRRLVGAVALALLAVIVLPMVMDQEPRPITQDIQIRIPNQDTSSVSTLARSVTGKPASTPLPAVPKPVATPATAVPAVALDTTAQTAAKIEVPPAATTDLPRSDAAGVAKPPKANDAKQDRPASPPPVTEQWIVQLGAYQDPANVKSMQNRIKGLGLPSFTEKVETPQGSRTRVRSGPFSSRAAAEKAQAQLKKMAIGAPAGGVVAQKP